MQRADQIVMAVLLSCRRSARAAAPRLQRRGIEDLVARAPRARSPRQASVRRGRRHRPCAAARRAPRHRAAASCSRSSSARASKFLDRRRIERLENQDARPRQQRRDQFERRILGRGADQDDRAVLHDRQKKSCWARLKRWISSTNSSVPCPVSRRSRAASKTFFRSATPEKIAEICSK